MTATEPAPRAEDSPTVAALKEVRARIERAEDCCRSAAREYRKEARRFGLSFYPTKDTDRLSHRADTELKRAEVELDLKRCLDFLIAREP